MTEQQPIKGLQVEAIVLRINLEALLSEPGWPGP